RADDQRLARSTEGGGEGVVVVAEAAQLGARAREYVDGVVQGDADGDGGEQQPIVIEVNVEPAHYPQGQHHRQYVGHHGEGGHLQGAEHQGDDQGDHHKGEAVALQLALGDVVRQL